MNNIRQNAIKYLQKRFLKSYVVDGESEFCNSSGKVVLRANRMIALDGESGTKHRLIAIKNLGENNELGFVSESIDKMINELNDSVYIQIGNANKPPGLEIDIDQMTFSSKLILYTNNLHSSLEDVVNVFKRKGILVEMVDESKMFKSLFISYGGPDELKVSRVNQALKAGGVSTWFFPDDSLPGQKLHRMMHEGVNEYDRVLLVCSNHSLGRGGVLNEIERVLEREASEGGSDILIPITLDDYVYTEWAPDRKDISSQIRSRVITKIDFCDSKFGNTINKILKVLQK